jgi:phage shock protein PspC (stress-responsive transcriptional regulator)
MIAGVCTGIAAHFKLDVALVRFAFVIAGLVTKGVAIVAYIVMMFVIPEANTPEQAAGGAPLNARDVVNRARNRTAATSREWRRHWRRQRRDWRRHWSAPSPGAYGPPPLAAAILPIFGLAQVMLFLVMGAMMISLVNTGAVLDWPLPPDVPVWAAALVLLIGHQVIVSPLRAARHWGSAPVAGPYAFWSSVGWLIGVALAIWVASNHIPEIAEFLRRLPALFSDFSDAVRGVGGR